jgi:hypothetical protein
LLSRRDYPTARRLHGHIRIRRPDLVVCLILVGPTVDPEPNAGAQIRRWAHDLLSEDPHQILMIAADLRDAGPRRLLGTLQHAVGHHMEGRIPLVGALILILRGEHDPIAPTEMGPPRPRLWLESAAPVSSPVRHTPP